MTTIPGWHRCEGEVRHYFEHEEGVSALNWEPKASNGEQRPPQFPPGADYWIMSTAIDRLKVADQIMPFEPARYERIDPEPGQSGALPQQVCVKLARPSCKMVLQGAYGNRGHQYEDSAPDGQRWLDKARRAYVEAAARVPARKRDPERAKVAQDNRVDRMIEEQRLEKKRKLLRLVAGADGKNAVSKGYNTR